MNGQWVEPDIRDDVISWIRYWSDRLSMRRNNLIRSVGISISKFYDWSFHYGEIRLKERPFNGWWGITAEEEHAIVSYRRSTVDGRRVMNLRDIVECVIRCWMKIS